MYDDNQMPIRIGLYSDLNVTRKSYTLQMAVPAEACDVTQVIFGHIKFGGDYNLGEHDLFHYPLLRFGVVILVRWVTTQAHVRLEMPDQVNNHQHNNHQSHNT